MKRIVLFLLAIILVSCGEGYPPARAESSPPETIVSSSAPEFDAKAAYDYVKTQVAFGPRVPNTKAHAACAAWMTETLETFTPDVIVQPFTAKAFDGTVLGGKNIIASFLKGSEDRILLCAHWDSRPFADYDPDPANHREPIDGANDGASGVGVLLEIARQLRRTPPEVGVDILLLDLEDYGEHRESLIFTEDSWALGSQYWARNPHKLGYKARFGILLDMVGAADARFTLEGTSMHFAPAVMRMVWRKARELGFTKYFIDRESDPIIDDHLYINRIAGIPMIDIIHYDSSAGGFFDEWHTTGDTMDVIDVQTLAAVGQTVLAVIYDQ